MAQPVVVTTAATAGAEGSEAERWLPALAQAIQLVHAEGAGISTGSFASLMDVVVRIFDHMGTVLHVAKHEMTLKTASLHTVSSALPTLHALVEADKAAGRATVKDSCARNLHRLIAVVKFVRIILEQLVANPTISIREAANKAYSESLAPMHIYVVRTAVWAGMYMLPAREHFMKELGETEQTARTYSLLFLSCCSEVESQVLKLFAGINMPVSQPSTSVLSGLWGGGAPAASQQPSATSSLPGAGSAMPAAS